MKAELDVRSTEGEHVTASLNFEGFTFSEAQEVMLDLVTDIQCTAGWEDSTPMMLILNDNEPLPGEEVQDGEEEMG